MPQVVSELIVSLDMKARGHHRVFTQNMDQNARILAANDRLGFTVPYTMQGRSHEYIPDFLLRLRPRDGDPVRTLIVEVSGTLKKEAPTREKGTARSTMKVLVTDCVFM